MNEEISGAEALIRSLIEENVEIVFGYPGASIMPVYDRFYDHRKDLRHVLTRHEQCAVHAAEGYARVTGRTGVVVATSGPGATNLVTGIADALMDSTPLVVITGQVASDLLGTDAFQETDVLGVTQPVSKWSFQIRHASDIAWAVARAFYIASSGRPGPVVLDITKNAQQEMTRFEYCKCSYIRSYHPLPQINSNKLRHIAEMINIAERPMLIAGHGVTIACAEHELQALAEKADIPVATTMLGLSVITSEHPLYKGMTGMHGNVAVNVNTNRADLIIAVGTRFADRVIGAPEHYAKNARIIHIDIDESEFNKNLTVDETLHAGAREALAALLPLVNENSHAEWCRSFDVHAAVENKMVRMPELHPRGDAMSMGEVVDAVAEATGGHAVVVTDVGLNQLKAARYSRFADHSSMIASGGLGTMGFGLPAAIGAKLGAPDRTVVVFLGDGGLQMTIQEFGTILETGIAVKIVLLNNKFLGNVRQLQSLFCDNRFSATPLVNPDFVMIARAYGIEAENVGRRDALHEAVRRMLSHNGSYLLNINIRENDMCFPMTPSGSAVDYIMLNENDIYLLETN